MTIEVQVIDTVLALCAGMLFLWAVPSYALRHGGIRIRIGRADVLRKPGPGRIPPHPRGRVPIRGFALGDVLGVSLFFGFYAGTWWLSSRGEETGELGEMEGLSVGLLFGLFLQGLQILLVVVLLFRRVNLVEAFGLRWQRTWWQVVFAPVVILMMWAFMVFLDGTGYNEWISSFVEGDGEQETVKLLGESWDPLVLVLVAVVACVGAPLAEEVVFRGYIYAAVKRFTNIPFAVIFTGLLFGAVHGNLLALLPLTVLGIVLALAYEYTGSLWAPIAIHFCFNAATVVIQFILKFNPELLEELEKNAGLILLW